MYLSSIINEAGQQLIPNLFITAFYILKEYSAFPFFLKRFVLSFLFLNIAYVFLLNN